MPTSLDRVQVLLQPDEYAEVTLLAKQERRSLASMSAVLIAEAINARVKAGTFERDVNDPAYEAARKRQQARADSNPKEPEGEKLNLDEFLASRGAQVVMKNNKKPGATFTEKQMEKIEQWEKIVQMEKQLEALKNEELISQSDG